MHFLKIRLLALAARRLAPEPAPGHLFGAAHSAQRPFGTASLPSPKHPLPSAAHVQRSQTCTASSLWYVMMTQGMPAPFQLFQDEKNTVFIDKLGAVTLDTIDHT